MKYRNTIERNIKPDEPYTLLQMIFARICNYSFVNKEINQIKQLISKLSFLSITIVALCKIDQFRLNIKALLINSSCSRE